MPAKVYPAAKPADVLAIDAEIDSELEKSEKPADVLAIDEEIDKQSKELPSLVERVTTSPELDDITKVDLEVESDPAVLQEIRDKAPHVSLTDDQHRIVFERDRGEDEAYDPVEEDRKAEERAGPFYTKTIGRALRDVALPIAKAGAKFAWRGGMKLPYALEQATLENNPKPLEEATSAWKDLGAGIVENVESTKDMALRARFGTAPTDALAEMTGLQDKETSFKNYLASIRNKEAKAQEFRANPNRSARTAEKVLGSIDDIRNAQSELIKQENGGEPTFVSEMWKVKVKDSTAPDLQDAYAQEAKIAPDPEITPAAALSPIDPMQAVLHFSAKPLGALAKTVIRESPVPPLSQAGAALEKTGETVKKASVGIAKWGQDVVEENTGLKGVGIPGTQMPILATGGLAGVTTEKVGGVLRSVGQQMDKPRGRVGPFEAAGKSAESSELARKLFGGWRGRFYDFVGDNAGQMAKSGTQGALLGPAMGMVDIRDANQFQDAIESGIGMGILGGFEEAGSKRGEWNRSREDVDISTHIRNLDPESQKMVGAIGNWDNYAQMVKDKAARLAADPAADKAEVTQWTAAAKDVDSANDGTKQEYARQTALIVADWMQLANGSGGRRNVDLKILSTEAIFNLLKQMNPHVDEATLRHTAESQGFATNPNDYGKVGAVSLSAERPVAVVNADWVLKKASLLGQPITKILGHEIAHPLFQIPEVKEKASQKLDRELFATAHKDLATGKTIHVTKGMLTEDDLVKMYWDKYLGAIPDKAGKEAFSQSLGVWDDKTNSLNPEKTANYMRNEVRAEVLANSPAAASGRLISELSSPLRHVADWARLLERNDAVARAKKALQDLGIVAKGDIESQLLGLKITPEVMSAAHDLMRSVKDLNGETAAATGYDNEAPQIDWTKIAADPALREKYKDSPIFDSEMVMTIKDEKGNVVRRVSLADPLAASGDWIVRGGSLEKVAGEAVAAPQMTPGDTVPEGGSVSVSREVKLNADGSPRILSGKEAEKRAIARDQTIRDAIDNAPDDGFPGRIKDIGNGVYRGVLSPSQLAAVNALPDLLVAPSIKKFMGEMNEAMQRGFGERFWIDYQASMDEKGHYKAIAPRIREVVPIGFHFSKKGNFLATTISVSRLHDKLAAWSQRLPERLAPWGGDRERFWADFEKYLDNWKSNRAGEVDLDPDGKVALKKKNILNDFLNLYTKETDWLNPDRTNTPQPKGRGKKEGGVDRTIMSARLDRITQMEPSQSPPLPIDYGKAVMNFMPAPRDGFYSNIESAVEQMPQEKFTPDQLRAHLKKYGGAAEEADWSDIERLLADKKSLTKAEAIDFIQQNTPKFEEKTLGDYAPVRAEYNEETKEWDVYDNQDKVVDNVHENDARDAATAVQIAKDNVVKETKYSQYTLPGGENYREVVLTMPEKEAPVTEQKPFVESYTSSHFQNVPDYVAHMRLDDRVDAEGNDGTFIEEIQSDRHQEGKKQGYRNEVPAEDVEKLYLEYRDLQDQMTSGPTIEEDPDAANKNVQAYREALSKYEKAVRSGDQGTPDAPFRKTWPLQMFKRALRDAVEAGHYWVGWTDGATQADRYDLSKQVDSISVAPVKNGKHRVEARKNGSAIEVGDLAPNELEGAIGKEAAKYALDSLTKLPNSSAVLEGENLKVGGEGMKGFYDNILPKEIEKYVKKIGGKVETNTVYTGPGNGSIVQIPFRIDEENGQFVVRQTPGELARISTTYSSKEKAQEYVNRILANQKRIHAEYNKPIWRVNITPEIIKAIGVQGQPQYLPGGELPDVGTPLRGADLDLSEAPQSDTSTLAPKTDEEEEDLRNVKLEK